MRVEYHAKTADDLNEAVVYYNQQQAGLGEQLRAAVYQLIDRIAAHPQQFPVIAHDLRRGFVTGFPYAVLFRWPTQEVVRILTIRHHRQHPNFGAWRQ